MACRWAAASCYAFRENLALFSALLCCLAFVTALAKPFVDLFLDPADVPMAQPDALRKLAGILSPFQLPRAEPDALVVQFKFGEQLHRGYVHH